MEAETHDVENLMLAVETSELSVSRLEQATRRMAAAAIDAAAAAAAAAQLVDAVKKAKEE